MNRKLAAVATFGIAALALAGCSSAANDGGNGGDGGSAETGELTVWIIGSDTPDAAREYADSLPAFRSSLKRPP